MEIIELSKQNKTW